MKKYNFYREDIAHRWHDTLNVLVIADSLAIHYNLHSSNNLTRKNRLTKKTNHECILRFRNSLAIQVDE